MSEIWRQSQFDSSYEVSSLGRVRSKDRMVSQRECGRASGYSRLLLGRQLKPFISKATGYLQVNLGGRVRHYVHRMVALEFCDGYADGLVVNHKNGKRTDNRAENLEWVTQSENNAHAFRELCRTPTSLGKFGGEHPKSRPVIATDLVTGHHFLYASAMDAVREGFDSSCISRCCSGAAKSHKGRSWRIAG